MVNNQDRSSATWSRADVATLVYTLAEEKAKGNWVDTRPNGAAWTTCELALLDSESRSGGGAKTFQSIQNRWQRLKQEFNIVKELRATSGFRWNNQEQSVTASRDVWDAYVKTHPSANKFRKKPFPLYDTIADLVDGTKGTGKNAFRAGQTPAFKRDCSPHLGPQKYNSSDDDELATPTPRNSDRKRSKSAGTSTSQRQKKRRVTAGHCQGPECPK
ncbi:hypothetical protein BJY52DRAFT_1275555 [Lactarius psammicola]|nr:hypothetical protein BJY52DRAFT_1275555 [Lactarius psammicola]